jgi:hypothetical protein
VGNYSTDDIEEEEEMGESLIVKRGSIDEYQKEQGE